jgi:serine/threonine-protein phosphatase 2A regulatory subunit B
MDRRMMEKTQPSKASHYKQTQLFGYKGPQEKVLEEDLISCLKYDLSGNHLALGDRAGRIIVFKEEKGRNKEESLQYLT